MADPTRYYIDPCGDTLALTSSQSGDWIKWHDFQDYKAGQKRTRAESTAIKLGMEVVHLREENERLRASSFVTAVPSEEYEKVKAENERLRKAGDAFLGVFLHASVKGLVTQDEAVKVIEEWRDAKGVQS